MSARRPQNSKFTTNLCEQANCERRKVTISEVSSVMISACFLRTCASNLWVESTTFRLSVYQGKSKTIRFINSIPIHDPHGSTYNRMQTWLSCPAIPWNPHRWHQGLSESRQASVSSLLSLVLFDPSLPLSLLIWCCNFTLRLHPFIQNFCHPSHYLWGALPASELKSGAMDSNILCIT